MLPEIMSVHFFTDEIAMLVLFVRILFRRRKPKARREYSNKVVVGYNPDETVEKLKTRVIPAQAGIYSISKINKLEWTPAFAGVTFSFF